MKLGKLQKAWIDALKSGRYRQTNGCLCQKTGGKSTYCCLGVYCKVFDKLNPKVIEIEEDGYSLLTFDGKEDELSDKMRKSIRMKPKAMAKLIEFNDDVGLTFKEIAAKIEANPATYFYGPA